MWQEKGENVEDLLEKGGVKLNVAKTEYFSCNTTGPPSLRIGKDMIKWVYGQI